MSKIIAVDFDGTLCEHKYPSIGEPKVRVIKWIKNQQGWGYHIILWTCRSGQHLAEAVEWCKKQGIILSAVNEDIPEVKDSVFGREKSCKIYADYYVDDKNYNLEGIGE